MTKLKSFKADDLYKIANNINNEFRIKIKNAVTFFNSVTSEEGIIKLNDETKYYYWKLNTEKREEFEKELVKQLNESNNKIDNYKLVIKSREIFIHFYYEKYGLLASEADTNFGEIYMRILNECVSKAYLGDYEVHLELHSDEYTEPRSELIEKLEGRFRKLHYKIEFELINDIRFKVIVNFNIEGVLNIIEDEDSFE